MTWLSKLGINETPYADIMLQQKNSIVKTWEAKKRHIEDNSVFGIIARDVKYQDEYLNKDFTIADKSMLENWIDTYLKHNAFFAFPPIKWPLSEIVLQKVS